MSNDQTEIDEQGAAIQHDAKVKRDKATSSYGRSCPCGQRSLVPLSKHAAEWLADAHGPATR